MAGDPVSSTDIGPIGTAMIMADLMRVMAHDSVVVVALAFFVVFLMLLFLFRSITRALSAYLPLVAGLVATAGLMTVMEVRLDFYNMIVIPSLIGIGVDTNIHLLHRYHTEGRGSWRYVINTTGSACAMAAVTTMIGFVGLLFAGHLGLRSIGTLAILGITTCTLVSVIMVPALLGWLETRASGTAWGLLPAHDFVPPENNSGGFPTVN
jgi:predicted RND superfamily exporter protein